MSRSYDFYIFQLEEPTLEVVNDRRAFHRDLHDMPIDEAREAYYRQTQDWQWQEEMARKEDERIERAMKESGNG